MKMGKILSVALSVIMIVAITLVSACTSTTPDETGTVEFRATDAPATGVSSIMVTTRNIQIHKADAPDDNWVTVMSQEKTFDLMDIQGAEVFLGSANVSSGNYTQIRLDVTKVIVTRDGKDITAKLPGDKLKIVRTWEVEESENTILTLDFDADTFVIITGNDQAQVKPVIKLDISKGERPLKKQKQITNSTASTTAPTVTMTINANGAKDVPVNTKVNIYFNEEMDPSTITAATFTLKKGSTPVSGTVTYAGSGAFFTPEVNLKANTEYTATITTGAKNLAGNALDNPYTWSWRTAAAPDTTSPMVSSTVPAHTAAGVPVNRNISFSFSKSMEPMTLDTTAFSLKSGATTVPGTITYTGVTATFNPDADLEPNTTYTAMITTRTKDLSGNALEQPYIWRWTTAAYTDTTVPTVSSTVPVDGSTGVVINRNISSSFSEAMDPQTINTTTFTLKNGATPVTGTVAYSGVTATFNPDAHLTADTEYTATITTGAKDLAGNALTVDKVWTFSTAPTATAWDTIAPAVISAIPAGAAIGVAIDGNISATFNEVMESLTLTSTTFTLKQGGVSVAGAVTYSGVTATFDPYNNLLADTEYTAAITTRARDLAGNPMTDKKVWTFTTGATAIANPTAPVMGEAGRFVILASQKITTTGVTAISGGDIGIEDQARTYYEGFTSGAAPGQLNELTGGLSYAHDDTDPALVPAPYASTITFIDQVRTDLGVAYTFLAADPNPTAPTQASPADLGGLTLTRGVYKSGVTVTIPTSLHLDAQGDPNSVWIFTIDGDLTIGATGNIVLEGGAQAKNVYWRVAGKTTIASGITFYGNVFSWAQINVLDGAQITGRLFSVTEQVTLIGDTVTKAR